MQLPKRPSILPQNLTETSVTSGPQQSLFLSALPLEDAEEISLMPIIIPTRKSKIDNRGEVIPNFDRPPMS